MKICFVSDIYPLLKCSSGASFGGAEVQQYKIARALRRLRPDWEAEFLVLDHGQPESRQQIEGLWLRRLWRQPQPRFPLWAIQLGKALRAVDADIYYQRCAGTVTGVVGRFCRRHGKRFVFSIANDRDVDGSFSRDSSLLTRTSYHAGLRGADLVIAQTTHQQQLLQDNFERPSLLIHSIAERISDATPMPPVALAKRYGLTASEGYVTWVGTLDAVKKQPELFLELARTLPDLPCLMIYRKGPEAYTRKIRQRAAQISNLTLVEQAPLQVVEGLYGISRVVVCTSRHEGFPNVLLEAWTHGLPVATLFDPDGVVARWQLGQVCDDARSLARAVTELHASALDLRPAITEYLERFHAPEQVSQQYVEAFCSLV